MRLFARGEKKVMVRSVSVTVAEFGLSDAFCAYNRSIADRTKNDRTYDFMENVLVERAWATHVPLCIRGWWPVL